MTTLDQTNAEVSDERLREIIEGCEGVTLGPWAYEQAGPGMADMRLYSDLGGEHRHSVVVALIAPQKHDNDAKHIARLDPATVKALATELLTRRSVTSQASDGAAQADTELLRLIANDPNAVHINLLRGSMARPSIEQIIHIYGKEALLTALTPSQPAAVGELLTRAATAARIMMEYDAWEVPAPAPADPIDYAWTAQVINDLAAALVHRDQVKL